VSPDATRERLLRELWDREGRYYDMAREQVRHAAILPGEYDFLRRHLPEQGVVLEVGCGEGSNLAVLERPGLRLLGCDLSGLALSRARREAPEDRARAFVRGDAELLPFAPGTFDAAFAVSLLEHLPDPGRVLEEMIGVLRRGGRLLLISPQYGGPLGASPCRRGGGAGRFLRRLVQAHSPARIGAERLGWERVEPLVLQGVEYDGDLDAVIEPEIGSLRRFLRARGVRIEECTSGFEWHTWLDRRAPLGQRVARILLERLGRTGIRPYRDFGPLIAMSGVKEGRDVREGSR
jgi:SAM-dependent methyltransferase